MSPAAKSSSSVTGDQGPRVLLVDDEPAIVELLSDVAKSIDCRVLTAGSLAEARRVIAREEVDVLVADVNLPDGDGAELIDGLRKKNPSASAIVITGDATVASATRAIRQGAVDFLAKPFDINQIAGQMRRAIDARDKAARTDRKLRKLKGEVRRLNAARDQISQKVDILCNDLISAYGELSKQMDVVRTQEGFRKTITSSADLEQLICQSMDWLMRQTGYSNVGVWLVGEDGEHQLGAYMKYTIPGDDRTSDAIKRAILPMAARDGRDTPVRITTAELADKLTPKEQHLFKDQQFLAIDCTYLGESLAALVFFRDEQVPFSEIDGETLKSVAPIFASHLAAIVRQSDESDAEPTGPEDSRDRDRDSRDEHGGGTADPRKNKPRKPDPADWWKRGEAPPF